MLRYAKGKNDKDCGGEFMKCVLLSVRPEWVCKILNGEKTIEVRKVFPKGYQGWVYIYCTKDKDIYRGGIGDQVINGKVVARFRCDKVEEIKYIGYNCYATKSLTDSELLRYSCLTFDELHNYLNFWHGSAIYINKLEIFDRPKELSEFKKCYRSKGYPQYQSWYLTRAPQNYCCVEVER